MMGWVDINPKINDNKFAQYAQQSPQISAGAYDQDPKMS